MTNKNLNVLIISTTNFDLDGITNVILNYYRAMDKSDMQIDFVVPNKIQENIKLELNDNASNIYQLSGRNKNPLKYIIKLTKIIRENNYNIVHAHGNSRTLALEMYSARKGRATVRIPHSHSSSNKYKIAHKLFKGFFDANYTIGFACSDMAGRWLFEKKNFEVIRNGIDIDTYTYNSSVRSNLREYYGYNENKVIGHIGHFIYPKNHDFLLDVFFELYSLDETYRLMLIGDGKLKDEIKNKAESLGLSNKISFIGKSNNVAQLMQAIDMIVMPSHFEGLPLTLIEAQAASLPCYISDNISSQAKITDLINFISLNDTPKEWAYHIHNDKKINRSEINKSVLTKINSSGYSIVDNAKRMKTLYEKMSK